MVFIHYPLTLVLLQGVMGVCESHQCLVWFGSGTFWSQVDPLIFLVTNVRWSVLFISVLSSNVAADSWSVHMPAGIVWVFQCVRLTASLLLRVWYRLRLETIQSRMFIWAPTPKNCWFDWQTVVTGYNHSEHTHVHAKHGFLSPLLASCQAVS